jgi:hypothetical protein
MCLQACVVDGRRSRPRLVESDLSVGEPATGVTLETFELFTVVCPLVSVPKDDILVSTADMLPCMGCPSQYTMPYFLAIH